MGASYAGSYEVTPPGRSRANDTIHQADESIERQQVRVRLTVSQTQWMAPTTSSLAYGQVWPSLVFGASALVRWRCADCKPPGMAAVGQTRLAVGRRPEQGGGSKQAPSWA